MADENTAKEGSPLRPVKQPPLHQRLAQLWQAHQKKNAEIPPDSLFHDRRQDQ